MRRSPALVLTAALVAGAFAASTWSPAAATPPGDTAITGNFYVAPEPPTVGQTVKLTANFPSGLYDVTFYKKTGSDPETWESIGSDLSNDSGNSYLTTHVVNGPEELYARITSGGEGVTAVKSVTPVAADVVLPNGPDVGNLYQDPATYHEGDLLKITANFPSGTFPITLYKETEPDVWSPIATKQSNSSGNAYFYDFEVSGTQKLFARKSNNDRTEVDVIAPSPEVTLDIQRDCDGNDCSAETATVTGQVTPPQVGRAFQFERLDGTTWTPIGEPVETDAEGRLSFPLDLAGMAQWSSKRYRLNSPADDEHPAATSNEVSFMPGPTELGTNVLRIDVDGGVFPTSKATEHTGTATLSENGIEKYTDLELENFGVRGTSTATFPKKAYKLKFLEKPKKLNDSNKTIFGMERHKSWSLLANWLDRSNVRDKVGLELGRRMTNIDWTPDSRYVELFVNDQYRGAYLLTESVKIDDDRVAVDEDTGMIMETDGYKVEDSKLGFLSKYGKIVFLFKDPDERKKLDGGAEDPSGITNAKYDSVKSRINNFESRLYSSTKREGPDGYARFIDVDSAIDFYLVKEFTKDRDADFYRSNYFWWDPKLGDGKFHFGPAWDFDRSAGVTSEPDAIHRYVKSPEGFYVRGTGTDSGRSTYKTHWFVQLFKSKAFRDKVDERWLTVKSDFQAAEQIARDSAAEVGVGALNDEKRWVGPRQYADQGSYQDEVDYVADWYHKRYVWINNNL